MRRRNDIPLRTFASSLFIAANFAALIPTRSWALDPPVKPPPEALRLLDKEREPAYRAARLKLRLILDSIAASKRGDEKRVQALKKRIEKIDENGRPEDKLTTVLNETRRLYRIEPSPGAMYDGKPHEWRIEYHALFALATAARRKPGDKRVAARTSSKDGSTVFVDPDVFESLPRIADILVHEAIHFEQFATGGFSTNTVVDHQEVEAYAAQLKYGPEGMLADEASEFRDHVEALASAMTVESDKTFWSTYYYRAYRTRRDRLPIRHRNEIFRLFAGAAGLEKKYRMKRGPEYWRGYLRDKRSWRFLRGTAARLCAAAPGDLKRVWTLNHYAVERPFAASAYAAEMWEYSDCEQDVLAEFIVAPDPVRYEDLMRFARAHRMRHGPWKARLAAAGGEFRARLTAAMSGVFSAGSE